MSISLYTVLDAFVAVAYIALAIMAIANKGYKKAQNRIYVLLTTSLLLWLVTNQISNNTSNSPTFAIFANYVIFGASFAMCVLLLELIIMITRDPLLGRPFRFVRPIFWGAVAIFSTPLVGKGVHVQDGVYAVEFGPLGDVYGASAVIILALVAVALLRGLSHRDSRVRNQVRMIALGSGIALPLCLLLGYIIPTATGNFAVTQTALLPLIFLAVAFYVSITRFGLFDVQTAVVRSTAYAFALGTVALIYTSLVTVLPYTLFRDSLQGVVLSPVSIILALALALAFQPIKRFFDHVTNRLFFRKEYDSEVLYAEFGKILAYNTDLMQMVGRATTYLVNTIRVERALFYVVGRGCLVRRPMAIDQVSDRDMEKVYRYIIRHKLKQAVLGDMLSEAGAVVVQKALRRREIQVLLPLWLGGDLLGVLLLGEHQGRGYVTRDLRVLNSIANEFAIAIQNSLSVEEIRQFNTTLQQRIEVATRELRETNLQLQRLDETKDEFISMASHQLRTPLTSIKGYISMLLDGDAGRVSAMQRRFLAEAFASSDRMVHLINDFLNVSRLRTGKFVLDRQPVDFLAIVREEVEGLQPIADQRQLEVVLRAPDVGPIITIDEHKLRQVVMNLIDNAIYYTRIESQILVKVAVSRRSVVLTVTDQGIGVPADEQPRLFGKFFRATNARRQRPDGTGIGLFLAQQVVAAHGGHMIFSSTEGKGSTFGFRLPRQ